MSDTHEITSFAIYPSIGIARVGNSPDGYFFGPELPGPHPQDPDAFRDAHGRIKRQAVRFRVYGLDAEGRVVKEITAADARITWKVEVANKKGAWYDFQQALDIPASKGQIPGVSPVLNRRRNVDIQGPERAQLAITPPRIAISGPNVNEHGGDPAYAFDKGRFFDKQVYLGELRTDAEGRLIFLGGRGAAASRDGKPAMDFLNNAGWHDDMSDGPVDALVEYQGKYHEATGAWVIVAPPNYAPGIQGFVTGYDLLFEMAVRMDPRLCPERPSFFEHIYPTLRRLTSSQWVNAGFARDYGFGTRWDFESPELVAQLNDPGERSRTLRHAVFVLFRDARYPYSQPAPAMLPPQYGDGMTGTTQDPREWLAVLDTQYRWLEQWADGDFIADPPPPVRRWEDLDAAEQVRLIDRGVLDETYGGPFHPGCEFTWTMRSLLMYAAPFRIKRRITAEPDLGAAISFANTLEAGGPLDGSTAGDITRWMAVPWQTDSASCLSGYNTYVDDYLPTWWASRVPNDVLSTEQYGAILDPATPPEKKEQAFAYNERGKWLAGIVYEKRVAFPPKIVTPYARGLNLFIRQWWQVGIMVRQPGPEHAGPNDAKFPRWLWVETLPPPPPSPSFQQIQEQLPEVPEATGVAPISEHPRAGRR